MKFLNNFFHLLFGPWGTVQQNTGFEYEFTPYFQYKIDAYEEGYLLYFQHEPNRTEYKDSIFEKMSKFSGYDVAAYLDYHYIAYDNKKGFLRFLRYELQERLVHNEMQEKLKYHERQERLMRNELQERLRLTRIHYNLLVMQTALEWVKEQETLLQITNSTADNLPAPVNQASGLLHNSQLPGGYNGHPHSDGNQPSNANPYSSRDLPPEQESPLSETEATMEEMARSYAGKIVFNNQRHKEKFIQILILLQDLKAPGTKGELLFQHFAAIDIAAIIRHIKEDNNKRTNTLQGYVTAARQNLDWNNPRVKKLEEALANFFYH